MEIVARTDPEKAAQVKRGCEEMEASTPQDTIKRSRQQEPDPSIFQPGSKEEQEEEEIKRKKGTTIYLDYSTMPIPPRNDPELARLVAFLDLHHYTGSLTEDLCPYPQDVDTRSPTLEPTSTAQDTTQEAEDKIVQQVMRQSRLAAEFEQKHPEAASSSEGMNLFEAVLPELPPLYSIAEATG